MKDNEGHVCCTQVISVSMLQLVEGLFTWTMFDWDVPKRGQLEL